jgi:hypothetical protein
LLRSGVIELMLLALIQESLVAYASYLLLANYDLQTIQRLLGHSDIKTTMIYMQTVLRGAGQAPEANVQPEHRTSNTQHPEPNTATKRKRTEL